MSIDEMRAALGLGADVGDIQVITLYGEHERAIAAAVAATATVVRDPFALAMGVLFRAAGSIEAEYDDGEGELLPIRIIRMQGATDLPMGQMTAVGDKEMVQIQRSDVAEPRKGDRLDIGVELFEIMGRPRIDSRGLSWICELAKIG